MNDWSVPESDGILWLSARIFIRRRRRDTQICLRTTTNRLRIRRRDDHVTQHLFLVKVAIENSTLMFYPVICTSMSRRSDERNSNLSCSNCVFHRAQSSWYFHRIFDILALHCFVQSATLSVGNALTSWKVRMFYSWFVTTISKIDMHSFFEDMQRYICSPTDCLFGESLKIMFLKHLLLPWTAYGEITFAKNRKSIHYRASNDDRILSLNW